MMSCGWQDMTVQLMFLSHSYGRYTQRNVVTWCRFSHAQTSTKTRMLIYNEGKYEVAPLFQTTNPNL